MRGLSLWCTCVLFVTPTDGIAQRLTQLRPGTLVRITTNVGTTIVGPLAEVRADTVFLSSTPQQPGSAVSLANVVRSAYADGTEPRSARRAALIGAGLGLAVGFLAGRGETNEFRIFSTTRFRVGMSALGAFIGFKVGSTDASPRWRDTPVASASPNFAPAAATQLGVGFRF